MTRSPAVFVQQALKAVFAFLVAGLGALQAALVGGLSFGDLNAAQWVTIVTTAVLAFGGVYGIANRPPGDQGEQAAAEPPPPPPAAEPPPPAAEPDTAVQRPKLRRTSR
jgi:hypothetical protein